MLRVPSSTRALHSRSTPSAIVEQAAGNGVAITGPNDSGGWALLLETTQGAQRWQRWLRATSCDELVEAAALVLALALDPAVATRASAVAPETAGDAEPPAGAPGDEPSSRSEPAAPAAAGSEAARSTDGAARTQPNEAASRDRRGEASSAPSADDREASRERSSSGPPLDLDWKLNASGVLDWGSLPHPAFGLEASAGVGAGRWLIEALGVYWPTVRTIVAREPDRGGDIELWALGLRGCWLVIPGDVSARACVGGEAGRLRGDGFGTTGWTGSGTSVWLAGKLALGGSVALSRPLTLDANLEATIPANRPEFHLEGVARVHRPAALVGRATVGAWSCIAGWRRSRADRRCARGCSGSRCASHDGRCEPRHVAARTSSPRTSRWRLVSLRRNVPRAPRPSASSTPCWIG